MQVSTGAHGSCARLSLEGEEEINLGPGAWCLIASVMSLVCKIADVTSCSGGCKLAGREVTKRCPNLHTGSAVETGLEQKSHRFFFHAVSLQMLIVTGDEENN